MREVVVDCGHCDGEGVCKRGDEDYSCSSCQHKARYSIAARRHVKCGICNGKGKVFLEK